MKIIIAFTLFIKIFRLYNIINIISHLTGIFKLIFYRLCDIINTADSNTNYNYMVLFSTDHGLNKSGGNYH